MSLYRSDADLWTVPAFANDPKNPHREQRRSKRARRETMLTLTSGKAVTEHH